MTKFGTQSNKKGVNTSNLKSHVRKANHKENKTESHKVMKESQQDDKLSIKQILSIECDNVQLREEMKRLQYEIAELREWKDKAVRFMINSAPKRDRIVKAKDEILQVRKDMIKLQNDLAEKAKIETGVKELREFEKKAKADIEEYRIQNENNTKALEKEIQYHANTRKKLSGIEQIFLLHLQKLISLRVKTEAIEKANGDVEMISNDRVENIVNEWLENAQKNSNDNNVTALMPVAQETIEWFEEKYESGFMNIKSQANISLIDELQAQLTAAQEDIKKLKVDLSIERGVVSGLESIQKQKDEMVQELKSTMISQQQQQREKVECIQNDLKEYVDSMQQSLKKKFGPNNSSFPNPKLWSKITTAINQFELE